MALRDNNIVFASVVLIDLMSKRITDSRSKRLLHFCNKIPKLDDDSQEQSSANSEVPSSSNIGDKTFQKRK